MLFRPCIDIHKGQVKQIVGSTLNSKNQNLQTNFVATESAAFFANLYKKDSLLGGHVIMLDDSIETKQEALSALTAFPGGLQIGGGITVENATTFLDSGASQVIVSSYIFTENKLDTNKLRNLNKVVGKNKLVLDLSCRKKDNEYVIVKNKWQTFTDLKINLNNLEMLAKYCSEFLIHGVDSEGKRQGIEIDLLKILRQFYTLPVTYAGGVKNLDDIDLIYIIGQKKIDFAIGSALDIFGGDLKYTDVVNHVKNK